MFIYVYRVFMRNYIFINYYLAGLYFGVIDSAQKYVPIKIHFDQSYFIIAHSALLYNPL